MAVFEVLGLSERIHGSLLGLCWHYLHGGLELLHGGLAVLDVVKSSQLRYRNLARSVHVPKSPGRRQMWTLGSQSEGPRSAPVRSEWKYHWFFDTFLELQRCFFASLDSSCLPFWDFLDRLCAILGSSWRHLGSFGSPLGHPWIGQGFLHGKLDTLDAHKMFSTAPL